MARLRRFQMTAAVALAAVLGVACSAGSGEGGAGGGAGDAVQGARTAEQARGAPLGTSRATSVAPLPLPSTLVVKTATLELSVERGVAEAVHEASDVAARAGGFVATTALERGRDASGTVVIRVPAERFESALDDLRQLGDLEHETVSGEDVSRQFVDLQARLRNWQAQEAVLLRLMDRSRSVADSIRVQGELARVQLEIERIQGRLSFLEDQTSFGTITATFVAAGPPPSQPPALARAFEKAIASALSVVSAVIIGAGFVLPVALLAGVVVLVVRGVRPRITAN
jgi:hypothetical protein